MSELNWQELAYTLFEEAGDALFLFDPETEQLQDVNPMSQRLSGFTRHELLTMKVTYLFRSEESGGLQRLRHAFQRTGLFHSQEGFWLRHHDDGVWVPVNITITRLHSDPRTLGLITARDIREQREAHVRLEKVEAELRRVTSSVSDCLWSAVVDQGGRWHYCYFSPVVEKITGRPGHFFLPGLDRWLSIVHPGDRFVVEQRFAGLRAGQSGVQEYRLSRADGSIRWIQDSVLTTPGVEGKAFLLDGIISDITERKHSDEALRTSEARYRSLIDNLTQSVFLKDHDLRFIAVNPPFCQTIGWAEEDILGKTDFDFFPEYQAEKSQADDRVVLEEGRRIEQEEPLLINGKSHTVRSVKSPLVDADGHISGVLGIFWDVTEQRTLEAQFRQAQKMDAIGQLAGGIAHDFNNLLTAMLGNLELVYAESPEDHPSREPLSNAIKAGFRAADLTRQLLSFARQMPLSPGPLDLNSCIEETLRLLRRTIDPRITIQVRADSNLWIVRADATQMGQVLMNLCLNARDAMLEGGQLVLETANIELDETTAAAHPTGRPGSFIRLGVLDTGHGMTAEVREHLFEPFFTTKGPGKGTGLGLAVVFGIVQQHEGWIECLSELEGGTCFNVYLPRQAESPEESTSSETTGVRGGNETIVLTDDNDMVRQIAKDILERHGYRVITAMDGAEAVETCRERMHEIDLVIIDQTMPKMSGLEVLKALRQLNPNIRVLVSSGYSTDQNVLAMEDAGASGFVAKPYRRNELARRVRDILDAGS